MPPAWQVLAAVTGFEHVLCEFSLFKKNWLRFRDGYLCYSGEAVERGLVYTLATASLCHGNTSHMVCVYVRLWVRGCSLEGHARGSMGTLEACYDHILNCFIRVPTESPLTAL